MKTQTSAQADQAADLPASSEGFLAGLYAGRFRWEVVSPFPAQDAADRSTGDAVLAELRRFLLDRVNPTALDVSRRLPEGLVDELRARGYLALRIDPRLGGLGLSFTNAFRVIEATMSWSTPVGWCLAIQNGLGAGAYLSVLPPGPLRELIEKRVAEGAVFSDADTEPAGAANERRQTTATPTSDGSAYLISGEKICIGNGPIADFLVVSATVNRDGQEQVESFFLDTATPGFRVRSVQEFMGLKGAAIAALTFDRVRVPKENMLTLPPHVDTEFELNRPARMYIISAPGLAIARLCAHWSREFVNRRSIDGRPLGSYDEIQRMVAATLADTFAIESVVEWCLLGESRESAFDLRLEQSAAKNISSVTCWRILDRTMSLLAAEGLETARSKASRGAQALPLERFLRDARALRIAGGVDFLLDKFFGETDLLSSCLSALDSGAEVQPDGFSAVGLGDPGPLSPRNQEHLRFTAAEVRAFPGACRDLVRRYRGDGDRPARDRVAIFLNRIANELFTMSVTLSRSARLAGCGHGEVQDLADIYCAGGRHRLADWWRQLSDGSQPDYARAATAWLQDGRPELTLSDVLTDLPPAGIEEATP